MSRAALVNALIRILQDSVGVAAEFVVEDALIELDTHPEWNPHPTLQQSQFLIILGKHLPPEVPYARLRPLVVEAMKRHSIEKK
jgi:hypothetical protein